VPIPAGDRRRHAQAEHRQRLPDHQEYQDQSATKSSASVLPPAAVAVAK
jgi:hypothetical protein